MRFSISSLGTVCAALVLSLSHLTAFAEDLAAGSAQGTYADKGSQTPVKLAFAGCFIDSADNDKPLVIVLSDKKVPTEKWKKDFDLMMASSSLAFSGVVFYLDKTHQVIRMDTYWKGRQASVAGYFDVKFDTATDKEAAGSAKTRNPDKDSPALDVKFHAALK